jgi:hypothetical protein
MLLTRLLCTAINYTQSQADVGRPIGSMWCWTSSNDKIAPGELGTVVGFNEKFGQVKVKFSKITWCIDEDELIPHSAWQGAVGYCIFSVFFSLIVC